MPSVVSASPKGLPSGRIQPRAALPRRVAGAEVLAASHATQVVPASPAALAALVQILSAPVTTSVPPLPVPCAFMSAIEYLSAVTNAMLAGEKVAFAVR